MRTFHRYRDSTNMADLPKSPQIPIVIPPPAKLGRPTDLTEELVSEIVQIIEGGVLAETASMACGINASTYYRWKNESEEFKEAINVAKAKAEITMLARIQAGGPGWQGSAWILERTKRDQYAPRVYAEITGSQIGAMDQKALMALIPAALAATGGKHLIENTANDDGEGVSDG